MEAKTVLGAKVKANGLCLTISIKDTDYYKVLAEAFVNFTKDERINKEIREEYRSDMLDKFNELNEKFGCMVEGADTNGQDLL